MKSPAPEYKLWYDKPAEQWVEALPVGNGRLGAMVFGNPETERIQFNEESLWAGCKTDNNNPESLARLKEIQQLIFSGEYKKAGEMASDYMVGTPPRVRSYQTFGDLMLNFEWEGEAQNYRRELDLNTGIASTTFEVGDKLVKQEVFVSAPHDLIVIRVSASSAFNMNVIMGRGKDAEIRVEPNSFIKMTGQIIDEEKPGSGPAGAHMKFSALAKVKSEGGKLESINDGISCDDVRTISIYLTAATNYDFEKLDLSVPKARYRPGREYHRR